MATWAIFKDFRGVLLCEKVDMFIDVWQKTTPARPAVMHRNRVVTRAKDAEVTNMVVLNDAKYPRDQYTESAFGSVRPGYVLNPNCRYMVNNYWGAVDVICFINNDKLGKRVHDMLAQLSPEGHDDVKRRDNDAKPHSDTDTLLASILEFVRENGR